MAHLEKKAFSTPDASGTVPHAQFAAVMLQNGVTLQRTTLAPGWRWSQHVQPQAGTPSCMASHTGVILAGQFHIRMDDGQEAEYGPGDALQAPPGHDAWVVGDEAVVLLDITSAG